LAKTSQVFLLLGGFAILTLLAALAGAAATGWVR